MARDYQPQEVAKGKIEIGIARMVHKYPFHVAILERFKIFARAYIATMAVTVSGRDVLLLHNPDFVLSLTGNELRGVLLHEVHHVLFRHVLADPTDYPDEWARTVAEEITANEFIVDEPLPDGAIKLEQFPKLPPLESTHDRYKRLCQVRKRVPISAPVLLLVELDATGGEADVSGKDADSHEQGKAGGSGIASSQTTANLDNSTSQADKRDGAGKGGSKEGKDGGGDGCEANRGGRQDDNGKGNCDSGDGNGGQDDGKQGGDSQSGSGQNAAGQGGGHGGADQGGGGLAGGGPNGKGQRKGQGGSGRDVGGLGDGSEDSSPDPARTQHDGAGGRRSASGTNKPSVHRTVDDHSVWEEARKARHEADAVIDNVIREAVLEVGRERVPVYIRGPANAPPGDTPGNGLYELKGAETGRLPWQQILRRYIGHARKVRPVFNHPPRRFPNLVGIIPGKRRQSGRPKIMVVIDTSASMTDDLLELIDAELAKLAREHEVLIVECDYAIQRVYEYRHRLKTLAGRGGTSFRLPLERNFLRKHHPDLIVFFTDGQGDAPEQPPRVPLIWCLTPQGEAPVEWGRKIQMEAPK